MLKNEKYMGDALLQKTYTTDFMTKKRVKNEGIVPQYYVEGNHEAIIPKPIFFLVQKELFRRAGLNKAAVKGNQKLSLSEIKVLMQELLACDNPYNCPHGRPTIISMSKYELERKFKR